MTNIRNKTNKINIDKIVSLKAIIKRNRITTSILGFCLLVSVGFNIKSHYVIKQEETLKVEAMKFALELNEANDTYIEMVSSLNDELDEYMYLEKLKKDLDRSWEGK